jgi:Domain of unknown function (DUF4258)
MFGNIQKPLRFTTHAEERMRERDITEAEVRETLAQPTERHYYNPVHETMNVRRRFPGIGMSRWSWDTRSGRSI